MKHLTIISGETEPHLTKDFVHYLSIEQHKHKDKFPINAATYKTKPQFNPRDVVVAERVLPLQKESEEKRFAKEEITQMAREGAYVFLLSDFMNDFGMQDFGINSRTGLTGVIFRDLAIGKDGWFYFRSYNGSFTRTADMMLRNYLERSEGQ